MSDLQSQNNTTTSKQTSTTVTKSPKIEDHNSKISQESWSLDSSELAELDIAIGELELELTRKKEQKKQRLSKLISEDVFSDQTTPLAKSQSDTTCRILFEEDQDDELPLRPRERRSPSTDHEVSIIEPQRKKSRKRLRALRKVRDNPRDLCIFANKIQTIVFALEKHEPECLKCPKLLRNVFWKLTPVLRYKWCDHIAEMPENIDLKKMSLFLTREAAKCCYYI